MLVKNITAEHVFLACGHTDMRKSIDGLAAIVQQNFKLDPFSQDVFMFCGRRKDRIKALFWDGDGFSLLYKHLDNGKFCWPKSKRDVISITEQQLRWLMEGLEICQPKSIKMTQPKSIILKCTPCQGHSVFYFPKIWTRSFSKIPRFVH